MATVEQRGGVWRVRWRERVVDELGDVRWMSRSRTVGTEREAHVLAAEIESALNAGQSPDLPAPGAPTVATVRSVALAYVHAPIAAGAARATARFRASMIGSFLGWLDAAEPSSRNAGVLVSVLSLRTLEAYAAQLPAEGRQAVTRHRKLTEVERMWEWAFKREEDFPGVPRPRRVTGSATDADRLRPPVPVVAAGAPTFADVDRMIAHLRTEWHRRVAVLLRFTGARISQALSLRWVDVDLEAGWVRWRAGVVGAKRGRTRVIPLHPQLREAMATWRTSDPLVFPVREAHPSRTRGGEASDRVTGRADYVRDAFRRAWSAAGVPRERWDAVDHDLVGDRAHGSPCHALRRCLRVGLIRAGVEEALALYLVGHAQGYTTAAYVPEHDPESSPYWTRLQAAVQTIPPRD